MKKFSFVAENNLMFIKLPRRWVYLEYYPGVYLEDDSIWNLIIFTSTIDD